ncbi:unnamed protein product [Cladocopium goreaui]|uniref:D-glucoside 3-dehydrogenase n=1 Tax=Cladocopium goreaui TaxID=2562237 RepID=A0A9P1FCM9_9DINO|nr:unnamed protein product [Cladocopium goreaui]
MKSARASSGFPVWLYRSLGMRGVLVTVFAGLLLTVAGCNGASNEEAQPKTKSFAGEELTLLVVDDPAVAKVCSELAAEWNARTGASYRVIEAPSEEALAAKHWKVADAAIYPSYLIGPAAKAGYLEPLKPEWLEDEQVAAQDVFPLLRTQVTTWGEETMALACGSPSFVCYYRADILRKFDRRPPTTWAEYAELAEFMKDRSRLGELAPAENVPWNATLEPLAGDWAALTLLARAATYAKHSDHYSALFKMSTMDPLIAGPPFVRALEELVELFGTEAGEVERFDLNEVRRRFWSGQSALAIGWPSAAESDLSNDPRYASADGEQRPVEASFCRLPASRDVFNPGQQEWEERPEGDTGAIPLLAIEGRLASICSGSDHESAALALIASLSGREWGATVFAESPATTLYRNSQRKDMAAWVEPPVSAAGATEYGELVAEMYSGGEALTALRIPGRDRYLAELSAAVVDALAGKDSPEVLLRRVAAAWNEITIKLGSDRQRQAYQQESQIVSKLDRIRVAVIGTGSISTDEHIPGWQAIPDAEIVALADASELALASAKKLVPDGVRLVNDYRDLLDDSDIDVFDICAPSALHAEISIAAMQAGKHVLCEKPMATCREDAARVLTARNETGRHYMTALHMRVDPSVVSLRKALESVPLGEVYYARAQWLRRRRLPGRKGFTTRALSGGGPSYDLGVHMFDLAWWMMGCPRPVRVSGTMSDRLVHRTDLASEWGEWDPATIDVEDFAAGWIRFENSAVLALETSWLMFDNVPERWQVQLYGDQAGAVWCHVSMSHGTFSAR